MLRLHDSQHNRNLRTRGVGFDERLLSAERGKAREMGLEAEVVGVELFQLEVVLPGSLMPSLPQDGDEQPYLELKMCAWLPPLPSPTLA